GRLVGCGDLLEDVRQIGRLEAASGELGQDPAGRLRLVRGEVRGRVGREESVSATSDEARTFDQGREGLVEDAAVEIPLEEALQLALRNAVPSRMRRDIARRFGFDSLRSSVPRAAREDAA